MCDSGGSPRRTTSERTNQSSANQSGELSLALAGRQFWSRPRQVDTNKKREVRSAAATELKLEVPFYEMSASFYLRLLYVLLAKFIQLFRLLNSTTSCDILQRFRLVSYV